MLPCPEGTRADTIRTQQIRFLCNTPWFRGRCPQFPGISTRGQIDEITSRILGPDLLGWNLRLTKAKRDEPITSLKSHPTSHRASHPMTRSETSRFGVEFAIDESEMPALDYAGPRVAGPDGYILINAPVNPNWEPIPGGEPTIEITVEAPDLEAAQAKAEDVYREIRKVGGLPARPSRVLGLFSDPGSDPPWLFFFDEAQEMLEQRRHEAAVVAAQVSCEIEIRAAIEDVVDAPEGSLARMAIEAPNSYSLLDRRARDIFEKVLGISPAFESFWQDYRDHVARRNNVLHNGARITREDAIASVRTAEEIVDWVQRVRERKKHSGAQKE